MVENMKNNEISIGIFPFKEVDQFQKAPFCVDGRAGTVGEEVYGIYPQMLGGSLMPVVLEWLINKPQENIVSVLSDVFEKLKKEGYPLGVHTSTHAYEGKSDCGFADNLGNILKTFKERSEEIRKIIAETGVIFDDLVWEKAKEGLEKINLETLPSGEQLINKAENQGATKQVLEGAHQEIAVIVNLEKGKTLDVDNNQQHQAFNLDLWLVEEIGEKMGWDKNLTQALSLGLYVATEMVLVEGRGKPRLPILINQ